MTTHQHRSRMALASLALGLLAACSSGGGPASGGGGGTQGGGLTFAVTDAPSNDIESFNVEISALQLEKAGGAVVSVISTPVAVDLAQLTDTDQILNSMDVPAGLYTSATITLDFTNAQCFLVGKTTPAQIQDASGSPLTGAVTLPMQFGSTPVNAAINAHHLLAFDFDLNQSVSTDVAGNKVSVDPAFVLRIDPTDKELNALGTLVSVDPLTSSFVAQVHTASGAVLGSITFTSSTTTVFQIDGVPTQGAAGLASLATKAAGTWIQAHGSIDPTKTQIATTFVEAGTGTWNGGTDIVEGHIIDRVGGAGSNATLTVLGHSSNAAHTVFNFNTTFTVDTAFANTKVVRHGSATAFDTDDLDVGQRVRIFASLSGTTVTATTATSVVREQLTRIFGFATGPVSGATLTMQLDHVDLRPQNAFTWSDGAGSTPPNPSAFTVDVGTLGNGLSITNGTSVEARGFFPAIDATGPNFDAVTLVNDDLAPSLIFIRNKAGGFVVTLTNTATDIQIAILGSAGSGEKAVVDHGFSGAVNLPTSPTPTITPAGASGFFTVRDKTTNMWTLYTQFSDFSTALQTVLGQGAQVDQLSFVGTYTAASNTMTSALASAIVH